MQLGDLALAWHVQGSGFDLQHPQQTGKQASRYTKQTEARPQAVQEMAKAVAHPMTHITLNAHRLLLFLSFHGAPDYGHSIYPYVHSRHNNIC